MILNQQSFLRKLVVSKTTRMNLPKLSVILCIGLAMLSMFVGVCKADPADEFWEFYETYPQYQDFFPFGVYGGGQFLDAVPYRGDSYAPVVEYQVGKGKVLILGGVSVNMMPGGWNGKPRPWILFGQRIRKFTLNALEYLASPTRFKPSMAKR